MKTEIKKNSAGKDCIHIEMDRGEEAIIISKNDKSYFLQVEIDPYDDICFSKRENFKMIKQYCPKCGCNYTDYRNLIGYRCGSRDFHTGQECGGKIIAGELPKEDESKSRLMFLTTEKAEEWKAGKWKHTYTSFYPNVKMLRCLSGDYEYFIELIGKPERILKSDVPTDYAKVLKPCRFVWKTEAKLVKIVPRKLGAKPPVFIENSAVIKGDET